MSSKYYIRQTDPDPSLWVKYACFSPFCDLFWAVTEDWGCWWGRGEEGKVFTDQASN